MSNNLPENLEEKASDLLVRVHPAGTGRGAGGGHVPWPAGPARGAAESQSQQPGGSTFFLPAIRCVGLTAPLEGSHAQVTNISRLLMGTSLTINSLGVPGMPGSISHQS